MTPVRRLHVGVLALVLATGAGALGLRALNDADPVSVDQAVERFRQQRSGPPAPGTATPTAAATGSGAPRTVPTATSSRTAGPGASPGSTPTAPARTASATTAPVTLTRPPEGVYVYATTGYETGKAGPADARHDYPAETTMTIRRSGCGSSMYWEPVEDRWDDITDCASGDTSKITVYDTFHEFFGVGERHTYRCTGDSWFRPPSTRAGFRWEFSCASAQARTHTLARIVGIERVRVGNDTVRALHVRFDTTMTGRTEGTNPSDYWLALDEPYLLRRMARVDAKVRSEFGTLDYHEEYDVRLVSRRPRT